MRLLAHLLGLDDASGPLYLFWSGFGADLPIVAGMGLFLRHHNCHERRCWRLGRLHADVGVVCHRHRLQVAARDGERVA